MGNCCSAPGTRRNRTIRANPFEVNAYNTAGAPRLTVLRNLPGNIVINEGKNFTDKYGLGKELGRGEFGITYLCTDKDTQKLFACKSIPKRKLRTAVDVEDVRREVVIMHHLPSYPNIVSLKGVYEDENAVHLIMEYCEGGELGSIKDTSIQLL